MCSATYFPWNLKRICRLVYRRRVAFVALLISQTTCISVAQTPPDAGSLLKQSEPKQQLQLPSTTVEPKNTTRNNTEPNAATIFVRTFILRGNSAVPTSEINEILRKYLNKRLTFNQLQEAIAEIGALYQNRNRLAKVFLPEQEVESGKIEIEIVEARFGTTTIDDRNLKRTQANRIVSIINAHQKSGELIDQLATERALLIAGDIPGVSTSGAFVEGKKQGSTDLALKLSDKQIVSGNAATDNHGARGTGITRYTGVASLDSALGFGETLTADAIKSQGLSFQQITTNLPTDNFGSRFSASYSNMNYRIVSPDFATANLSGLSSKYVATYSHPILRQKRYNLYFLANINHANFTNYANYDRTSQYYVRTASITISGNLSDSLGNGGETSGSISLRHGQVNLNGSPNHNTDATSVRTGGHFNKFEFMIARTQTITDQFALRGAWSQQLSDKNLDSSEKLFLGGPSAIRAYPVNEAGGAHGSVASLEMIYKPRDNIAITTFLDRGEVKLNHDNNYVGAPTQNILVLKGAGLKLYTELENGLSFTAIYSRRIGSNPNPTTSGADQDGSRIVDRIWGSINYKFMDPSSIFKMQ